MKKLENPVSFSRKSNFNNADSCDQVDNHVKSFSSGVRAAYAILLRHRLSLCRNADSHRNEIDGCLSETRSILVASPIQFLISLN